MASVGVWFRGLFGNKGNKEDAGPALSLLEARTRPGGAKSFGEDNNDFALALYTQLRQPHGNLFVWPFSIRIALGMTQAGARGDTAAQMREALCISSSDAIPMYVNEAVGKVGPSRCQTAVPKRHLAQMVGPVVPEESDAVAH